MNDSRLLDLGELHEVKHRVFQHFRNSESLRTLKKE
jgi:hypothetical protein